MALPAETGPTWAPDQLSIWPVEGRFAAPSGERMARAVHYPVMLFFLAFTFVHVVLVLTTGALRKLNQMYTARDTDDWLGFVVFALSIAATVAARAPRSSTIARAASSTASRSWERGRGIWPAGSY